MNSSDASGTSSPHKTSSAANPEAVFDHRLEEARTCIDRLFSAKSEALDLMKSIQAIVAQGGTLYTCGNGGSAAQALHFSEELLGRFRADRRPLPSTCLNADPTALTCIANDYGFQSIFSRQAQALLGPGDGLVVFSTSGRSENIINVLNVAAQRGSKRIGFLGGDGGPARDLCDVSVVIEGSDTASIQEAHQTLLHACCELLEEI